MRSARRRPRGRRLRRRGIVAIIGLGIFCVLLALQAHATYDERGRRGIAESITRAILARDLTPVAGLFAEDVRGNLNDDVRLGAFADQLAGLGELREVREIAGKADLNAREYMATFTHGEQRELISFDGSRVVGFTLER